MIKKIVAGMLSLAVVFFGGINVGFAADKDCGEFSSASEVWEFWNNNGGTEDPFGLDRDTDGLPCEGLTAGTSNPGAAEEEAPATETNEDGEDSETAEPTTEEEEGGELADTATSTPMMMFIGLAIAGSGALLFGRKKAVE